jgi:methylthioribose-1-phosphate isomerase
MFCPFRPDLRALHGEPALYLLDQRLLPEEERWIAATGAEEVAVAIETLAVRGAPAIGCVAAWGVALAAATAASAAAADAARAAIARLARTRPTAVDLFAALAAMEEALGTALSLRADVQARLEAAAAAWTAADLAACRQLAEHGAALVPAGAGILTHCNAGALATSGWGTALGVVRTAHAQGKAPRVYADETRPVLQGARLTAWELARAGISVEVLCDGAAAWLMARGEVRLAIVGADRIVANGDFANKIGTYALAIACRHHGIPLYVAAPTSTLDPTLTSGAQIPIEERAAQEVALLGDRYVVPAGVGVRNPAFDVTPGELVTAFITESGVFSAAAVASATRHPAARRSHHSAP